MIVLQVLICGEIIFRMELWLYAILFQLLFLLNSIFLLFIFFLSISFEWNNIGISDRALEALASAVITNKNLVSLDMRNNRLGSSSVVYIADIIRQSALQSLDLRWNELGPNSAKSLLAALQGNTILKNLELAGNKLGEDTLGFVEEILNRNRGGGIEAKTSRSEREVVKAMFSPSKTAPTFAPIQSEDHLRTVDEENEIGLDKMRATEYRTRYDEEIIERERTEKKLNEAETNMKLEREKNAQIRDELLKQIDSEKAVFFN